MLKQLDEMKLQFKGPHFHNSTHTKYPEYEDLQRQITDDGVWAWEETQMKDDPLTVIKLGESD